MAALAFQNAYKTYENGTTSLTDFNWEIECGGFTVLLGPSGAGKSTVLRVIAGMESLTSGTLLLNGQPACSGAFGRDVAMMFQSYGLLPGLTVYHNLAYGLKLRKVCAADIDTRVREAAALLGIEALLPKRTQKLSLMESRRVMLARLAVRRPALFLMDEPLSGLDMQERGELCGEILRLHRVYPETTCICATGETETAAAFGKKIALLNGGRVVEEGLPQDLYKNPQSLFTAAFFGDPPMNFFRAERVTVGVFPEDIRITDTAYAENQTQEYRSGDTVSSCCSKLPDRAEVVSADLTGDGAFLYLKIWENEPYVAAHVKVNRQCGSFLVAGQIIRICFNPDKLYYFDADTGKRMPPNLLATENN